MQYVNDNYVKTDEGSISQTEDVVDLPCSGSETRVFLAKTLKLLIMKRPMNTNTR